MNVNETKNSSRASRFVNCAGRNFFMLDQFGETFTMKIDDTNTEIKSSMGAFCSIILILVVSSFMYQKVDIWLQREDVDVWSATQSHHFPTDYQFTHEMGLNIAFAFSGYDNIEEDILDPSYGSLVFTTYEWGEDAEGVPFLKYVELESHTCSKAELGLEGEEASHFFPIRQNKQNLLRMYQKKFKCIEPKDMFVNGDFDSDTARLISLRLNRCVDTDTITCKSEEEITAFFRNKLLLILYN